MVFADENPIETWLLCPPKTAAAPVLDCDAVDASAPSLGEGWKFEVRNWVVLVELPTGSTSSSSRMFKVGCISAILCISELVYMTLIQGCPCVSGF